MKTFFTLLLSGVLVLSAFVGCSSKGGLSGLYPCEGTVTYNGAPVDGASVTFYPDGGTDARSAGGRTDARGVFQLTTLKPQDGVFPGNYTVTIIKYEEYGKEPPLVMNSEGDMIPSGGRPVRNVLPAKYGTPETSGLTSRIEKRKNTVSFDLTD